MSKAAKPTITVVGQGYIGLPTALILAKAGWKVRGVDHDLQTVAQIARGKSTIPEPGIQDLLHEALESGRFSISSKLEPTDCYIVSVPTPIRDDKSPDLSFLTDAIENLMVLLEGGELIVVESTVPPGTTAAIYEKINRLSNLVEPVDVVHVPERVLPGNILEEFETNSRIIGCLTRGAGRRAKKIYSTITKREIQITTATTAELCKLTENSYRDVNLAFANEISIIAEKYSVNPWELITLANQHPRVDILAPGVGVGGHCIAVDPWFLVSSTPGDSELIKIARDVNDKKTLWVASKALDIVSNLRCEEICIYGLTFKPDVKDTRQSPSITLIKKILESPLVKKVYVVDPFVDAASLSRLGLDKIELLTLDEAMKLNGLAIFAVKHSAFQGLNRSDFTSLKVLDACGLFEGA